MAEPLPLSVSTTPSASKAVLRLQAITLVWMLVECAVSLYGAGSAHSVVLLAFGSDSLVELLSAGVVLLSFTSVFVISRDSAARAAGLLLFALAAIVAALALASLWRGHVPETSCSGIGITIAALIAMPVLAWQKRRLAGITGSRALAADAVQSATCAWLAAATLAGLALNAVLHVRWIDPVAALAVLPLLLVEGKKSMRGESCNCCSC